VADGGRQIMAWLVPGDFCDLHVAILGEMDHSIAALGPCRIAEISRATIAEISDSRPVVNRAMWWATLVDEGVLREWLVGMGRRPADRRIGHLFCELHTRLAAVGLTDDGGFDLPVSQTELADTVGLTPVHVNRVLQQLREDKLIRLEGKRLTILDFARLAAFADFDPNYLHLTPRRRAGGGDRIQAPSI
jgi:CRP-like cAMP-binding protein